MSLINCPSCQNKISDKATSCPNCHFSFRENEDEIDRLKIINYRKYRNKMYQFKMLSFVAIAIALAGVIPMLWNYAKAVDYGFNANIINHWGIYLVMAGFALYVIIRILMVTTKNKYKSHK
jgi:FtsH-binding integral membrane protein